MASTGYAAWAVTAGEQPTTAYWNILGSNDASFNSGAGFNDGILIKRHFSAGEIAKATNPYKFFFSLAALVGTGTGGFFTVALDTPTVDPNSNCNTTTHAWTCPVTGFYSLSASTGYAGSGSGVHHITTIFKGGVEFIRFFEGASGDSANHVFSGAATSVPLTAGDVLTLVGYSGTNYNMMNNGAGAFFTYMSGVLTST